MAGTSTKDIKNRIKSVENTGQITKAMELVATSKLRKAKILNENMKPFFTILTDTLNDIKNNTKDFSSVYTRKSKSEKKCVIVIAGDRGMAGGYNANVFKKAEEFMSDAIVLPIGKKAIEYFKKRNAEIISDKYTETDNVSISDCHGLSEFLSEEYKKGTFGELIIVYTKFVSMLSQEATAEKLLPVVGEEEKKSSNLAIYEPSPEAVFERIVGQYIAGIIYSSLKESLASEFAARRTAMESANKNAQGMIDDLTLKFNRARQAAITQEITEIVSGAE